MTPPDPLHCLVSDSRPLPPTGEGELSGVRAAVKDCLAAAGHRSSFGHPRWRETHPAAERDAAVIGRLRRAGASIIGLTKMDQLAYSLIGNAGEGDPPVNPHDPACFCGGSSSGSAAAVAGGVAELGVGTDTAGSIRVPAAACGLYGLRPTHGRLSVKGVIPLAPSLDVVGFLAQDPVLLERALAAAAPGASDDVALRRLLLPKHLHDARIRVLARECGLTIEPADVAQLVSSDVGDLMARIQGREIWATHGTWAARHIEALAPDVQLRLRRCHALSQDPEEKVDADLAARARYRATLRELLGSDGVLVMPVLPRHGPRLSWTEAELIDFRLQCFRLTAPSSLAGLPQLVVPGGLDAARPISLVGPLLSEHSLLAVAPYKTPVRDVGEP